MSQLSPNLNVMIKAAEKAARSLLRDFGEVEKLQVSRKGPGDFVSRADTRAEEIIHDHLETTRPGYGFMMEESGEIKTDSEYRWIIDPLDGTKNFLHGVPYWNISIALEKAGEVISGVVLNPVTDELFRAEKGRGAFVNRQRLRVSGRKNLEECLFAFGNLPKDQTRFEIFKGKYPVGIRRSAACALDMAYVAAGRYDGFLGQSEKAWDFAAGALLVQEAGGVVCDIDGEKKYLEKNCGIFCSNANLFPQFTDLFNIKPQSKKSA